MSKTLPNRPSLELEQACDSHVVAGVDEAGRGPWAGPVVAAAVVLDPSNVPSGINDSKKLSEARRESLFDELFGCAEVGVGIASVEEIDDLNILKATFLAMARAVDRLPQRPGLALVDGSIAPKLSCPSTAVIKGDAISLSVAAASIVAKVTRDRIMADLDHVFPDYGWRRNKGYGTKQHRLAIESTGVSPHHRSSFKPIAAFLEAENVRQIDSPVT